MENEADAPVAVFKKRAAKGRTNIRKRAPTSPPTSLLPLGDPDDSLSDDGYDGGDGNFAGGAVKRRRRGAPMSLVSASTKDAARPHTSGRGDLSTTVFSADRSVPITDTNDATKRSDWYDEEDGNKVRKKPGGADSRAVALPSNPDVATRRAPVGPIKAPPTNVRTITLTDYAPDTCTDYRKTGFCGFGDACKFLHSRDDLRMGWQLDREWETATKGKKNLGGTVVASANRRLVNNGDGDDDAADEAMLEKIPFACVICKDDYRSPIITRCGHYFCESCALSRYRSDPTCAACGANTNGMFNVAKRLNRLLERKREREERKKLAEAEAGEEVLEVGKEGG